MSNIPSESVRKQISCIRDGKFLSTYFGYAVRARAAYAISTESEKIDSGLVGSEETVICPINELSRLFYIPPQFVEDINSSDSRGMYGCFSHDDFNCFSALYYRTDFMQSGREFLNATSSGDKFDKMRSDPQYMAQAIDYSRRLLKCAFVANRHENTNWKIMGEKKLRKTNDLALQIILAYSKDMKVSTVGLPVKWAGH